MRKSNNYSPRKISVKSTVQEIFDSTNTGRRNSSDNGKPVAIPVSSRREQILKAAARLFAERGYHAVGMTDLQEAVHLGRGALYHHIKSKEEVLYQISKGYIVDLVDQAALAMNERDPRQRIRLLGRHLILTIASHQSELTVCFREVHSLTAERRTEVMALHADYERVWRDTMVEGAEAYCFRPFDPIVHKGILGMYYYSYLWMHLGGSLSAESIAERFNHLALRMLAPDASLARHEDRS